MELLNKVKNLKTSEENSNFDSYWTLDDDYSQASLSTTSLSIDTDEFKYMDDDSESSSSDEIYSLETSLIEMNRHDEPLLIEDRATHNQNWCHQASPMIGRTINFYDNDNFTDDTLNQLANKGFAQSLSRQTFAQKHAYNEEEKPLDILLAQLKDKRWLGNLNRDSHEMVKAHKNPVISETLFERSFDIDLMDNEDLLSISSHGSDRSATPVDARIATHDEFQKSEHDNGSTSESNLLNCRSKFGHKAIEFVKPKLLMFTDDEDIESLSPIDDDCVKYGDGYSDDEDGSTVCGENWKDYQNIEFYKETLYHQPPKSADRSAAQRLARRLFDLDGFKLTDVSKHLSKRNDFSQLVGEEFANFFEFHGLTLDSALRKFLEKFILNGDTQERERVIHHFSRRYLQCNSDAYNSEEACHTLVCAVMLLNVDLHGNTMNRKMTCDDFVASMAELNGGGNFKNDELVELFNSILNNPIRWNADNELIGLIQPKVDYTDFSKQISASNFNFYLEVPSESTSKEYMSGYLLRKCIRESHFRRTSIGKRGWKLYFGRLHDLTLFLYKDDISLNGNLRRSSRKLLKEKELCKNGISYSDPVLTQISPNDSDSGDIKANGLGNKKTSKSLKLPRVKKRNSVPSALPPSLQSPEKPCSTTENKTPPSSTDIEAIGSLQIYLNHAFASKATDYSKKRNVFRLQVSSGSEYLFQVNEPREVELWVDCLNFVAALLSPPVFNNCSNKDSVNSSVKKSKPLLTTLNIKEQLESHQRCVLTLEQDLMHLNSKPPSKSDKTKLKWQYNRQRKFIERELIRYKTYSRLLEFELIHLHNLAIARMSQQAFIDPYIIPVQYSQMSTGSSAAASPMFYNQQTNQFVPLNCVPANVPVFQFHPGYGGGGNNQQSGNTSHNNSIKELSEDSSAGSTSLQSSPSSSQDTAVSLQPIIIRSSYSCSRSSRSQLGMNKRRRYRNNSLQQMPQQQQQQQQQILMHYNLSSSLFGGNNKKVLLRPMLTAHISGSSPSIVATTTTVTPPYPHDSSLHLNSGTGVVQGQSLPSIHSQSSANGNTGTVTNTFYEIL